MKNIIIDGDPSQKEKAEIVENMMPFIKSIVGRAYYPNRHPIISWDDLMSAGVLGLLEALDRYKPSPNNTFKTFAYYRVHGSVVDFIRMVDILPKKPRSIVGKTAQATRKLEQKFGRLPSDAELVEELGLKMSNWKETMRLAKSRAEYSLDTAIEAGQPSTFYDILEDEKVNSPELRFQTKNLQRILENSGRFLTDNEMGVINFYYFSDDEYTLREIGEMMGFSEARASQLKLAGLNKLSYHLKYLETGFDYV